MKIKVLHFVSTLERGGPTSVIYNIMKYLDRQIFLPEILTISPEPEKSQKAEFEELGITIHQMHESRFSWMLRGGEKLRQRISTIAPDIIHSHSVRPDVASARHLKGFRRLATIHANLYRAYSDTYGSAIGAWFTFSQLAAMKQLEKTVACSNWVYNLYKEKIHDLTVIQNGIDQSRFFLRSEEERMLLRKKFSLPLNKKIFISAGGLTELKDPVTLMKAFISLKHHNAVLVILGDGPEKEKVARYATEYPERIFYKGFSKELHEYYAAADYFISASHSEGLPNSVMEALASGLPVILSDIVPHREILDIDKRAGYLFPCNDEILLAQKVNEILSADFQDMQHHAVQIITSTLNAKSMTARYQEHYLDLYQIRK